MPRVPTYDNFQVDPTNLPNVQVRPVGARFDAPFTEGMATAPGRQLQAVGQGLTQAGAGLNKIVLDEFEQAVATMASGESGKEIDVAARFAERLDGLV